MNSQLSFLFFLCAFIGPCHCLSCLTCVGTTSCVGSYVTCLSGYSCGLAYQEVTEDVTSYKNYIRSCVPTNKCNKVGSITYFGGKMKMGISCCNTDNCTPLLPQWPADSSQTNGLVCPTCRSQNQYTCTPQMNIQCTGSEQTCIYESAMTAASSESALGCASPDLCNVGDYSYSYGSQNIFMGFYCFSGTNDAFSDTSCIVCSSSNSLTCTGPSRTMPSNYMCASAYRITTTNGVKTYEVVRSWAPVSKCNVAGTMTVSGTRILVGISCCDGGSCNPSITDTTATSTVSNKVKCETCYSSTSSSCQSSNVMTCTGDETQCVTYATTISSGSIPGSSSSVQGCGVKTMCDVQSFSFVLDYMTVEHRFTCVPTTNGGNSIVAPRRGLVSFPFFSTIAVILILNQFNKYS
ncbi:uncharacterized protein [Pyxicephalus adspersus]|uniref:uncharacterized protein n=1 Tax=Pyxicephalus adspersus TaxID=30357 RepID=UPI003B5A01BC